jgi:hypothetical protein
MEFEMRRIVGIVGILAAATACRNRPVSFVVPEVQTEAVDVSSIAATGDSSWRASAEADIREHAHGVQSASIPAPRQSAEPVAPPDRVRLGVAGTTAAVLVDLRVSSW